MRRNLSLPSMRVAAAAGLFLLSGPSTLFPQEPQGEWTLSVGARESNEFERIVNDVEQDELILDNANVFLGYTTRSERSEYGLFGRVGANAYREGDNRNHFNYGGGFSWKYMPSTRSSSTLSFGANRGFRAQTLSELGVLEPGMDSTAAQASWGYQYRTSPQTTISTGVAYQYIQFDSDQAIPGSQVVTPGRTPFRDDFPPLLPEPSDDDPIEVPDPEGDVVDILATEGFFDPNESHSGTAMFGVSRSLSEYSSLGFDLAGGYRTIQTGQTGQEPMREGGQGAFRFWAQRRAGQSGTLSASYDVTRALILDPATTVQTAFGGYSFSPGSRNVFLRASGGVSYYLADNGVSSITPVADLGFSAGITRSLDFNASYRRQFAQSLGYGTTLLIDYGHASLTQRFGSKVDLTFLAGASFGEDPLIEESRQDAMQAGATLAFRLTERFTVGTSFFALRTDYATTVRSTETDRKLVSVFINYTTTWR